MSDEPRVSRASLSVVLGNWGEILQTQNLSEGRPIDPVSRWLLITRASVFPMTIFSAMIGGLLAIDAPRANGYCFGLALVGLVIAHAANNMINDYFDVGEGVDTIGYARTVYAPHPILSGLISPTGLLGAIAILNGVDLAILVLITVVQGAGIVFFALAGLFISVFYVAPPLKLKHRGLGEPGVFIVWGPLMIGGTYLATTGELPLWVLAASTPYALLVTAVLIGKHVDKLEADAAKGIRTLPVMLGREAGLRLDRGLMVSFYVLVAALVATGVLGVWTLLILLSIPRLLETLRVFGEPQPHSRPSGYPIWPLWYVAWAFRLTRQAGALLVTGLVLNSLYPVYL
ncbi:MAG: prenyltransferase [Candidatus Binatia bacterium]